MKLMFEETYNDEIILFEATFQDGGHLRKHYNDRVLKPNQKLLRNKNPRFPNMTKDQYKAEAELLSIEDAGLSSSNDPVIGVVHDHNGKERLYKIRLNSKFEPGYMDVVSYTDIPDFIYTFFLAKKNRLANYMTHYVDELPENKSKIEQ